MAVLHRIEGRDRALFIDCAFMGQEPGSIRRFTPEEVRSTKVLAHQSLHEADLLRVIGLAEELGQCPPRVVIFGIEPEVVDSRGRGSAVCYWIRLRSISRRLSLSWSRRDFMLGRTCSLYQSHGVRLTVLISGTIHDGITRDKVDRLKRSLRRNNGTRQDSNHRRRS